MAEFGDIANEFHKLPTPAKIAVAGAVPVVIVLGVLMRKRTAASDTQQVGLAGGDGAPGAVSTNAPPVGGTLPLPVTIDPSPAQPPILPPTRINPPTGFMAPPAAGSSLPIAPVGKGAFAAINLPHVSTPAPIVQQIHQSVQPPATPYTFRPPVLPTETAPIPVYQRGNLRLS